MYKLLILFSRINCGVSTQVVDCNTYDMAEQAFQAIQQKPQLEAGSLDVVRLYTVRAAAQAQAARA